MYEPLMRKNVWLNLEVALTQFSMALLLILYSNIHPKVLHQILMLSLCQAKICLSFVANQVMFDILYWNFRLATVT